MSANDQELDAAHEARSKELMCRYKAGERAVFDELQRLNDEAVRSYITRKLGRRHEYLVEPAAANVWIVVYKKADRFDPEKGSFRGFLIKIARTECKAVRRRRASKVARADGLDPGVAETVASAEPIPGTDLAIAEEERWVEDALAELTPKERAVVEALLEGKSLGDIGDDMGTAKGTVQNKLARIRDKISAFLGRRTG
jgi:RNA polymerase sigma-70 factor (ECF subfamily)